MMTAAAAPLLRSLSGLAALLAAVAAADAALAQMGMGGRGGGGMEDTRPPEQYHGQIIDPSFAYRDGVQQLKAGHYRQAEEDFEHVLDAAPDNGDVLLLDGLAKEGEGDLKGAARAYGSAVRREPGNIIAHQQLGAALARLNQPARAKVELDLLQKKSDACHDACADAAQLKSAIGTVQAAMAAGQSPPSAG
jgi:predicted Zn-dependent protease